MNRTYKYVKALIWIWPVVFSQSCREIPAPTPHFRNIVVIISDDHTFKAAGCYGNSAIRTPNDVGEEPGSDLQRIFENENIYE